MNEELCIAELIRAIQTVRYNITVLYTDSSNDNVRFYLRNSLDYLAGLLNELNAALESAQKGL
jgi:hypothetical protein